jgi:hypothetical protein
MRVLVVYMGLRMNVKSTHAQAARTQQRLAIAWHDTQPRHGRSWITLTL